MKRNLLLGLILVLVVGFAALGIKRHSQLGSTFKIGADLMLTGSLSESQEAFRDGVLLAIDEINKAGGIDGKTVSAVIEDDQMEPTKMVSIARKLVDVDKVDAAIVSSFINAQSAGAIYEQAHTPVVVLWDSNPQIDAMGDYVFAIGPWTPSAGEVSATFSANELKAKKVAVIATNEPWPVEVVAAFKKKFEELGGEVVDTQLVNLGQGTDFRSVITKAISYKPDVLYTPISENSTRFYQQLALLNYTGKVVTSDIITDSVIQESGAATDGIYQTQPMDPTGAATEHMKALYREKFGKDPINVLYTAWGYDAVGLIAHAARSATTREQMKDNFYKIKDYPGASALLSITAGGSAPMIERMFKIENGKFVPVSN